MQLQALSFIIGKRERKEKIRKTHQVQNNYLFDLMLHMLAFRMKALA
jgi:hypothetical protein